MNALVPDLVIAPRVLIKSSLVIPILVPTIVRVWSYLSGVRLMCSCFPESSLLGSVKLSYHDFVQSIWWIWNKLPQKELYSSRKYWCSVTSTGQFLPERQTSQPPPPSWIWVFLSVLAEEPHGLCIDTMPGHRSNWASILKQVQTLAPRCGQAFCNWRYQLDFRCEIDRVEVDEVKGKNLFSPRSFRLTPRALLWSTLNCLLSLSMFPAHTQVRCWEIVHKFDQEVWAAFPFPHMGLGAC